MSTQLNPAPLASYLLVCWPFAIYSLNGKKLSSKILGAATIVLDVACLLLTFCRSAFLGLACMIFFYLYVKMGHKKLIAALIIFVIFVELLYLAPYPFNRLGPAHMLFLSNGAFSEYRLTRIRMVWEIFKSRPFLGIGFNHFRILFDTYHSLAGEYSETPYEAKIADNMYLTLLAEAGAIGLVSFLIFIFYLFKKGLRALLSEKQKQKKQMLFISLCALTALLVDTAGYELFYWENPYMLFCLICGFVCGLFSQEQPDNI
jgi:O-antigen ligase